MKPEPKFAVGERVVSQFYGPGRVLARWWWLPPYHGLKASWAYCVEFDREPLNGGRRSLEQRRLAGSPWREPPSARMDYLVELVESCLDWPSAVDRLAELASA